MIDSRIKTLCQKDINLTLPLKTIKLGEEVGEAQAEILSYLQASNASKTASGTLAATAEELLDVIIVAESILAELDIQETDLSIIKSNKLDKWESKINKYYS